MLLIGLSKTTNKNIQAENEVLTKLILEEFNKLDQDEVNEIIEMYFEKSPLTTIIGYEDKNNLDKFKDHLYRFIFNTLDYYKNDYKFWLSLERKQRKEFYGFSSALSDENYNYCFGSFRKLFDRKLNHLIANVGEIYIDEKYIPEFIMLAYARYFELNQNDLFKFKEFGSITNILNNLSTVTVVKYVTSKPYELTYHKSLVKEFLSYVKGWNAGRSTEVVKRPYETIESKTDLIKLDITNRTYKILDKMVN